MSFFANVKKSEPVIAFLPLGGCLDICTGAIVEGHRGEMIVNGGFAPMMGVVGKPHMFKSTVAKSILYQAFVKVLNTIKASLLMYDTEITVVEEHQREMFEFIINNYSEFRQFFYEEGVLMDLIGNDTIVFTNKNQYKGEEYNELLKKLLRAKDPDTKRSRDDTDVPKGMAMIETPFKDREGKPFKMFPPTGGDVDSITEFTTTADEETQDGHELGDKGANPAFMTMGLNRQRFLMSLPGLLSTYSHYVVMTAQVGKEIVMQTGPTPVAPGKQLSAMKNGDVLKGTSSKFVSLANVCWQTLKTAHCGMSHKVEDGPRYPLFETKGNKFDNDLFEIELLNIRNKNGPTGFTITILVSQSKGFLPDLTEFHHARTHDWGFGGNQINYFLQLMPDLPLTRTTIRKKLPVTPGLQRAVNITSELLQMKQFKPSYWQDYGVEVEELYTNMTKLGFSWEEILTKTRGWYSPDVNHPIPHLSIVDLLRMNKEGYIPHWMDPVTKRIKA